MLAPPRITLLFAAIGWCAGRDAYELVGNGWCLDRLGRRLKLGPQPWTHSSDMQWQGADVGISGSARRCEARCSRASDCIGYMTEDRRSCDILRRSDHHAQDGIASADGEQRNYCWARVRVEDIDANSGCEATVKWHDGRQEERECVVLA